MLDFKEGQTYVCTKANERWLTEGKEYEVGLSSLNKTFIVDDDGDRWTSNDLSVYDSTFKLKDTQPKVTPQEGQTYVCKRDDLDWWTLDKEYKVQTFNSGDLCIKDDDETKWYVTNDLMNQVFKLKEQPFDLNKLTTAQLKEYIGLLENKENAESLLNDFIERMTK